MKIFTSLTLFGFLAMMAWGAGNPPVDISKATLVIGKSTETPFAKAGEILQQEIASRTNITLNKVEDLASVSGPAIVVGMKGCVPSGMPGLPSGLELPGKAEAYALWVDTTSRKAPTVCLMGYDVRGAIFAAGNLLRQLHMGPGKITVDPAYRIATAPVYPIRVHQIGYRNTANSYDAWSPMQFEQYCRELFLFGANGIELIPALEPPGSESIENDDAKSPHMKVSMWDMTRRMSEAIGSYGMQVWIWLALPEDVTKPGEEEKALARRATLFKEMPNLDAVFIPGGDPGDTAPEVLMPFLAKLSAVLKESHPNAKIWVSNQGFEPAANDTFFNYLNKENTDWLGGIVYGPWAKTSLTELRARTPKKLPIRDYPDITHSVRCQYPVPEWDRAFAHTLGRECVNPRPVAEAHIFNLTAPNTVGFGTYSDGINDDVNKMLWSRLGWDPKVDVKEVMRDYGRFFISDAFANEVGEGLLSFEQAWKGPLLKDELVSKNLDRWQALEKKADEKMLTQNWRFQHGLLRAYYDRYVQLRLVEDTQREEKAMAALSKATLVDIGSALASARVALVKSYENPQIAEYRKRLEALGRTLFGCIGMQLDVANYKASGKERGAVLEYLDVPLNNKDWLLAQFKTILDLPAPAGLKQIETILKWEDPGPGGFYDDLGNAQKQPHLARQGTWAQDPGSYTVPIEEFNEVDNARLSWEDQAHTLFGTPLQMKYEGLDKNATYKLRVTYAGRFKAVMKLVANGSTVIHEDYKQPSPLAPVEFDIPQAATAKGVLSLEWRLSGGRGCQVAEVWLIKK